MTGGFRWGFKKEAEEQAIKVRRLLRLSPNDRLDPRQLALHVGIPVFEVHELLQAGMTKASLRHLLGPSRGEFSAALFERSGQRLIVANPAHSDGRQASNIVHEIAHVLLSHRPPETILEAGCRRWDEKMELEADWLAGELLVPRRAALDVARSGLDLQSAAMKFGVSPAMMRWRLNHSGSLRQAERERVFRHRRQSA